VRVAPAGVSSAGPADVAAPAAHRA
jgi:hypothetical protein